METGTTIEGNALSHTSEDVKIEDEAHDACVICLDAVTERAVALPCRHHNFDFLCIVSWLQERTTCPLCKSKVHSVEYGFQSDNGTKKYVVAPVHANDAASASGLIHLSRQISTRSHNSTGTNYRRQPRGPPPSPDSVLSWRRQIYRDQLYSLHVGSNRLSRFHDITPEIFARSEELISQARKWIRRELHVFEFLSPASGVGDSSQKVNNREFLLEYIVAILKTVDIKGSGGQAEDMLQEFLGRDNARLFLHELRAWLRSPYVSLESWDRNVQYNDRVPRGKQQGTTPRSEEVLGYCEQPVRNSLKRDHGAFRGDFYRPNDCSPTGRKVRRRTG